MSEEQHGGSRAGVLDGGRGRLLELLAVFFLLCAPNLFFFLTGGSRESSGDVTLTYLVADMLMRVGWCALIPILLSKRDAFDWKLPKTGREWGKEFGWGLALILAIIGCSAVIGLLVSLLNLGESTQWSETARDPTMIAAFLMFTPIIGLEEELLFRVYAQTRLTQVLRSKTVLPVFIASGVFAAMHGYSLAGTLMILVFGLVLGASYQANGKIPRLVFAHTIWNVAVTILGLYS
jgi:membrane protease YdiL (CAAX protease family)